MPVTTVSSWGDAVFLGISNAVNTFLAAIPQVVGALLIILIGWIISNILARLTTAALARVGADRVFVEHGAHVYGQQAMTFTPSVAGGEVVKWIVRLIFLVAAANVLGMPQVSELLNDVLLWIPNLIVAAVVLLVAPLIARFVRGLIEVGAGNMGFSNAALLGRIAEVAVIAFAVLVAVNQLGIAADLVNILFIGVVGAAALAFGLAFGLGGRDVAAEITQRAYQSSQAKVDEVRGATPPRPSAPTGQAARSEG